MTLAGARERAGRFLHGREDDPRVAWCHLPRDIRTEVAQLALRGEPHPYPFIREKAAAWAAAVCAVPFFVAWGEDALSCFVGSTSAAMVLATLVVHDPWRGVWTGLGVTIGASLRMVLTRARARRVLRANRAA